MLHKVSEEVVVNIRAHQVGASLSMRGRGSMSASLSSSGSVDMKEMGTYFDRQE